MTSVLLAVSSDSGCFLVVLIPIALIAGLIISSVRTDRLKDALRLVAQRLNGRFTEGGWVGEPTVEFSLAGKPAKFEFFSGSKNSPSYSRVVVHLGGHSPGTLHILPDGFGQSFLKL